MRMTMTSKFLTRALATGALLCSAPSFAGYTLTDLGDLAGGSDGSFASALNNSGTVAGSSDNGFYRAVAWIAGGPPQLIAANASAAYGINDAGQIVGGNSAFLWSSTGGYQNISANGTFYVAKDINNGGTAVGDGASTIQGTVAYTWDAIHGAHPLMGPTVTGESHATSINDAGQITGTSEHGANTTAFFYNPGDTNFQSIGTLSSLGFSSSYGTGINAAGQIAGLSTNGADGRHGFLWSSSDGMIDLGDLAGGENYSVSLGINDAGYVVGNSGAVNGRHGFLWSSTGGMVDLNGLISNANGFTVWEGDAINNVGQIVGYGTTATGAFHAFLLTPDTVGAVPEPATWAMMLVGFGAVGYGVRRGRQTSTVRFQSA